MAVPTSRQLLERIEHLETENYILQYRLDEIANLIDQWERPEEVETAERQMYHKPRSGG